ncbi:MAG: outer membrane protein assembly factor BamB [Zoogloeaceae bacterium]|nr:outer membrane protein assembly factor BamB [Zoogloeaceae bacterium]
MRNEIPHASRTARRVLPWLAVAVLLGGCSSVTSLTPSWDSLNPFASAGPKMAELPAFSPTASLRAVWGYSIGKSGGAVFYPAVAGDSVFVAAADGSIARLENGVALWRIQAERKPLSAGVGSNGDLVVVAADDAILAFSAQDGAPLWQARTSSEVLAPPLVTEDLVVIKSGDNRVVALDHAGKQKWLYQRATPTLFLRNTAPMAAVDRFVLVGFPGGKLMALSMENGAPVWEGTVALPKGATELDRMADVVSPPAAVGAIGCAVAFQGRVTCFDFSQGGATLWSREISSVAGLSVDQRHVYVTDDLSAVHALSVDAGSSVWKQDKLLRRRVTAPLPVGVLYLAAGDARGVVHLISRADGEFAARLETDGTPIDSMPQPMRHMMVVQTRGGHVYALEVE